MPSRLSYCSGPEAHERRKASGSIFAISHYALHIQKAARDIGAERARFDGAYLLRRLRSCGERLFHASRRLMPRVGKLGPHYAGERHQSIYRYVARARQRSAGSDNRR